MSNRFARRLPSRKRQRQAIYLLEVLLIGMLFIGIERGNVGIVVNTAVALAVTQLPSILERDYEILIDPWIALWITGAAFLHALGTVGIPGLGWNFYATLGWWDHMTHALSASVVAAAGYATVRALDAHTEDVSLPSRFIGVFILLFVLAFGVLWELLEFAIGLGAAALGTTAVLTQYGVYDTLWDLVYNSVGAVIVALGGGIYLTDLSEAIGSRFDSE